jgi:hypothetical protein
VYRALKRKETALAYLRYYDIFLEVLRKTTVFGLEFE